MVVTRAKNHNNVAVLGSMFEMGSYARKGHMDVGKMAAVSGVDVLITVGEESKWIHEGALKAGMPQSRMHHYATQDDMIKVITELINEETIVLLKASRGMHLERTRDYLIESFEEVQ